MSAKTAKLARKIGIKTARHEAKKIAEEQIRQLFAAPLWLRIKFALRVIFKR
jgi:hypothetical protein